MVAWMFDLKVGHFHLVQSVTVITFTELPVSINNLVISQSASSIPMTSASSCGHFRFSISSSVNSMIVLSSIISLDLVAHVETEFTLLPYHIIERSSSKMVLPNSQQRVVNSRQLFPHH